MSPLPKSFDLRWKGAQPIGTGFRKTVWRAFDVQLSQWVALKIVMSADLDVATEELLAALRRLVHPNVVRIYDAGVRENQLYIVEELLDRTLAELAPYRPLDDLLDVLAGLAAGLAYLHAENFVHRDVKPDNCGLVHGVPKIFDFGTVSQAVGSSAGSQRWGNLGTRAPELVKAEASGGAPPPGFTKAQDVWAFGATAFFVATGTYPFATEIEVSKYSKAADIVWRGAPGDKVEAERSARVIAAIVHARQEKGEYVEPARLDALNGLGSCLRRCTSYEAGGRPPAGELPRLIEDARHARRAKGNYLKERAATLTAQIRDELRKRQLPPGLSMQMLRAATDVAESLRDQDAEEAGRLSESIRELNEARARPTVSK